MGALKGDVQSRNPVKKILNPAFPRIFALSRIPSKTYDTTKLTHSWTPYGLNEEAPYSNTGRIIVVYKVFIFFPVRFVKHRRTIPTRWFAFFTISTIWVFGDKSSDTRTPRSLCVFTSDKYVPLSEYLYLNFLRILSTTHFPALKRNNQVSLQNCEWI